MTSISQIKNTDINQRKKSYYHVKADEIPSQAIKGVQRISLLLEAPPQEDGDDEVLSQDLIDVILGLTVDKNCLVALDIPYNLSEIDYDCLLELCDDLGVDIAIVPPDDLDNEKDFEAYKETIFKLSYAYFKSDNFSQMIFPVVAFVRQIFREIMQDERKETNLVEGELNENVQLFLDYYGDLFSSGKKEQEIKAEVEGSAYKAHGSKKAFLAYAKAITDVFIKAKNQNNQ